MERTFVFIRTGSDIDLPPVYAENLSDLEEYLKTNGVKVKSLWKERLKKDRLYTGEIYGTQYKYGFTVDGDTLLFLFTVPSVLNMLDYMPVSKAQRVLKSLWKGFLMREFIPTGGFQVKELIGGALYVGVEW